MVDTSSDQTISGSKDFEFLTGSNARFSGPVFIDESLTIPNATQILWGYRNFDFSKINKLTVPTNPYRTDDGKEVLILSSNFYDFITSQGLLD